MANFNFKMKTLGMAYKILQGPANLFQALHYADPLTREALQLLLICSFPTYYSERSFWTLCTRPGILLQCYFLISLSWHLLNYVTIHGIAIVSRTYSKRTEMVLISLNATSPGPRIELVPLRY